MVFPQVLASYEGLLVAGLLGQRAPVRPLPLHDCPRDGGAEPVELGCGQEVGDHHEAALPERLDQFGGYQTAAHGSHHVGKPVSDPGGAPRPG
jgi:hypothetical protein